MGLTDDVERISKQMFEDGSIDAIIKEQLTKSVTEIVRDAFISWSDVGKALKENVESRMLESINGYDWDSYIPKLDAVLTDVVNCTTITDTKEVLENFKVLMVKPDEKMVLVSDLFDEYQKIVAKRASHDGHDVEFDSGEPEYEPVEVEYNFEKQDKPRWSSCDRGIITFSVNDTEENESDERINIEIPVYRWDWEDERGYVIESSALVNVNNLRNISDLELMVMKLARAKTRIVIDVESDEDTVSFEEKPEADWS